jgi:hypothetical protein
MAATGMTGGTGTVAASLARSFEESFGQITV